MTGIPLEEWSTVEAEGMMLRGDIEFQLVKLPVAATEVNVEAAKRVHRQQLLIFHHLRKSLRVLEEVKIGFKDRTNTVWYPQAKLSRRSISQRLLMRIRLPRPDPKDGSGWFLLLKELALRSMSI